MSERFIDLKIQAECAVLLLHELRLVIAEFDLEVEDTLPLLLGADFIVQMESLGLK